MKKFLYLLALLAFIACNEEDQSNSPDYFPENQSMSRNVDFLKLIDNQTEVAGMLEFKSDAPTIDLKWNLPDSANLDTTLTSLSSSTGIYQIPIKWDKKLEDGGYGPKTMAYDGGVLITSGETSKYIRLFWADEIDSVKVAEMAKVDIKTRAVGADLPKASSITIVPLLTRLNDKSDICGVTYLDVPSGFVSVDVVNFRKMQEQGDGLFLNTDSMPSSIIFSPGGNILLSWESDARPEPMAMSHIAISSVNYTKFAYFQYYPDTDEELFVIKRVTPSDGSTVSSEQHNIEIEVESEINWWAILNGIPYQFNAGNQTAKIFVDTYHGKIDRQMLLTIGHDVSDKSVLDSTVIYTQQPGGELTFVRAEMPDPIPVTGSAGEGYPFFFDGSYLGNIQIQATLEGGTVIEGIPSDNLKAFISIPSNTKATKPRTVKFAYRKGTGDWQPLSTLDRKQEGSVVLPYLQGETTIVEAGGSQTCLFGGTYAGPIKLRVTPETAFTGVQSGMAPGSVTVTILPLPDINDREIRFEYSIDDGSTWEYINSKIQTAGNIRYQTLYPEVEIPARQTTATCIFDGTYRGELQFRAKVKGDDVSEPLAITRGTQTVNFSLAIPANNSGKERIIAFEYKKEGSPWVEIATRPQKTNIKVDPDNVNAGGFEDKGNTDVDVEL